MHHRRKDRTVCSPARAMLDDYELRRHLTLMFQCLTKEAFRGWTVSAFCYQNINEVPILIHRPPQVVALAMDCDEHFIDVPDVPKPPLFPGQRSGIGRPKLDAPASNRLV
jgi:hypothetical protein